MQNIIAIVVLLALLISGAVYTVKDKVIDKEVDQANYNPVENVKITKYILDLSNQNLSKTPEYIFGKTNAEELDLSNNNLEGSLQAEIRHLENLKVLNLSNNKFSGVPAEIGQLSKLEVLNLSNNKITGLPYELGNLSKLKILDLTGNNYSKQDLAIIKDKLPKTTIIKND
jgi:Leucine-rich repeat (LRR) protein